MQEILGVGQTVGANRAQIRQLEMVVAVPVGGRRIGERGIRYHKRRERNEREQKKRTEKEKKDKKEKQKNCVNACAHVSLSLSLGPKVACLVRCHTHCFLGANLPTYNSKMYPRSGSSLLTKSMEKRMPRMMTQISVGSTIMTPHSVVTLMVPCCGTIKKSPSAFVNAQLSMEALATYK